MEELRPVMPCMECNRHYNTWKYSNICPHCGADQFAIMKRKEEETARKPLTADEFVCGFIVCIRGAQQGKYFCYYRGNNPAGYGQDMTIPIEGKERDWGKPHFSIMFDDRQ